MKKLLPFLLFAASFSLSNAQDSCNFVNPYAVLESNRLAVKINNDGTLFYDEARDEGFFKAPYIGPGSPTTIRKAGLWLGGFDIGGNLKMSASAVDSDNHESDFMPGPLNPETSLPYEEYPCEYFDWVWEVSKAEIVAHQEDFRDNGIIDKPLSAIMNWPGNGNPYFRGGQGLPEGQWGWAPFYDNNGDNIYDPLEGDFPWYDPPANDFFYPEKLFWTVFNDYTDHPVTGGVPTRIEVQLTAWTRDCEYNNWVEGVLFTEYKFINRALEDIDSLYIGFWVDFDIGCGDDDYLGSMPSANAFYAYNADPVDGDPTTGCSQDVPIYGNSLPVQSVSFFGHLPMSSFTYYMEDAPDPNRGKPTVDTEFYNYLTGRWRFGERFTSGGDGYDPTSTDYSNFAFPDNPSESDGWSMYTENLPAQPRRYALGSVRLERFAGWGGGLQRGEAKYLQVAFGYHNTGDDHLGLIDRIENVDLHLMPEAWYLNYAFNPFCSEWEYGSRPEKEHPTLNIYPNPTAGPLTITLPETPLREIAIFNSAWQLLRTVSGIPQTKTFPLDLSGLPQGLYFLKMNFDGHVLVEKVVVSQ